MTLLRQYRPSARITFDELDGLLKLADDAVAEHGENGEISTLYYVGMRETLNIIRYHEWVDFPEDFMLIFERKIAELERED